MEEKWAQNFFCRQEENKEVWSETGKNGQNREEYFIQHVFIRTLKEKDVIMNV